MLSTRGVGVLYAKGDADVLVVRTAVECAASHKTTVVGENTDRLVVPLHHVRPDTCILYAAFFRSDKHAAQKDVHGTSSGCH